MATTGKPGRPRQKPARVSTSIRKKPPTAHLKPPWKPGQSGNPKGRPTGARQRLTDQFITDLSAHYAQHGAGVIARVAEEDPVAYMSIVARFIPKETEITINGSVNLDPAQMQRIAEAWIVAQADIEALESDYVIEAQDVKEPAELPAEPALLPGRVDDVVGEIRDGVEDDFGRQRPKRRSGIDDVLDGDTNP